jgi:hypothetical protein
MPVFTITANVFYKGKTQPVSTNVTVPSVDMQNVIQGNADLQAYIIDLTLGGKHTHTFGSSCKGDRGTANVYVHKTDAQLIGYASGTVTESTNTTPGAITISCFGRAVGNKHNFATDGSQYK